MAKETGKTKDSKKQKEIKDGNNKSGSKKKLIKKVTITLLILLIAGGGGFSGYYFLTKSRGGILPHIKLDKNVMTFAFENMPAFYSGLKDLSNEISLIEKEIVRIKNIEKKYPEQQKITAAQIKLWEKNLDSLKKTIEKLETELSAIYVSWRVDKETGEKLMEPKKTELVKSVEDALAPSKIMTDKLKKIEESKGFFTKILEKAGL
jgi:hypothetical protein